MMRVNILFFLLLSSFSIPTKGISETGLDITIESHHIVLEAVGGELIVTNALLLNVRDITNAEEKLAFSIPEGYKNLEILSGLDEDSLSKEKDRLVDLRKLKLGKLPVAFRYRLNINHNTYIFLLEILYDTNIFYFLVKNVELEIESDKLTDRGLFQMGEKKFHALSSSELKKGEKIEITIKGLGKKSRRKTALIISGILLVIIVLFLVLTFSKEKRQDRRLPITDKLEEKKKTLVSLIARLDEEFENGEIDEKVYRELRKENKDKLKKTMLEIDKSKYGNAKSRED